MKIINQLMIGVCRCERCGTIFQPEPGDTFECRFGPLDEIKEIFIKCPTCDCYCETSYIVDVTDINVGNKSEWISVEERLPETEGKYLVCTTNGNIGVGSFIDYYGKGTHLCFDCWAVTHWMPLPEPPKGE